MKNYNDTSIRILIRFLLHRPYSYCRNHKQMQINNFHDLKCKLFIAHIKVLLHISKLLANIYKMLFLTDIILIVNC